MKCFPQHDNELYVPEHYAPANFTLLMNIIVSVDVI